MNKINSEFNACMHKDTCIKLQSRIAQLETELAEARKDQARYQTMRKAIVNRDRKVEEILLQNLTDAGGNDEFDAAVDLAIKEQQ